MTRIVKEYEPMYKRGYRSGNGLIWFAGIVVALLIVGWATLPFWTRDSVSFTVDSLERVCDGGDSGGCRYLIFTEDGETYKNGDQWLVGKTNSSDLQSELDEGASYECDVYGFRISLLSMYRNVIECTETAPAPTTTGETE